MKQVDRLIGILLGASFLFLPQWRLVGTAAAKLDCGPVTNKSNDLPRTAAIGTSPAGSGAHSLGSGLAAVASKATPMTVKVQPFSGPNTFVPLLESGELEFGIINILDTQMAALGTGNYKKAYPSIRVATGGVFPFTTSVLVRDKSDIKQISDLRGKRLAWDFGGHAVVQTLFNAALEVGSLKPADIVQFRVSALNDGIRAVGEGKVDATFSSIGTGIIEEVNTMEAIRFLGIPNTDASNKILSRYGGSAVKSTPATGIKGETYVIGYPLHIATSSKVSEKTVATVLKAWWDNVAELQTIHPLFKQWTKEGQAITNFTTAYHPGAVKFYKEAGVWTAKHDARLKEICG
jgi:hypothetical protein